MDTEKIDRAPRATKTRAAKPRRKPWQPPSMLDAPSPPEGYVHRWIRAEVRGFDDRKNVSARIREGWELVRKEEYPEFEAPTIDSGRYEGVFGVGGLLLARIPVEIVDERTDFFLAKKCRGNASSRQRSYEGNAASFDGYSET